MLPLFHFAKAQTFLSVTFHVLRERERTNLLRWVLEPDCLGSSPAPPLRNHRISSHLTSLCLGFLISKVELIAEIRGIAVRCNEFMLEKHLEECLLLKAFIIVKRPYPIRV